MFALHLHAKIPLDFSSGIFCMKYVSCATEIDLCESQFMEFQYRKRYSPVQQNGGKLKNIVLLFQYRKRYSPVQHLITCFLTSSLKFQYRKRYSPVQPRGIFGDMTPIEFQYRKRYSPVQPVKLIVQGYYGLFQYRKRYSPVQQRDQDGNHPYVYVSIPQAVFACATVRGERH